MTPVIAPAKAVKPRRVAFPAALASAVLLACLTACGGSGSDDDEPAPAPEPVPVVPVATQLSGVVATGAALAQAAVLVVDRTGTTVCDTQTDAQGAYQCTLAASVERPLVIRASKDDTVLYSTTATAGDVHANVTPLTHIIVSKLAPNGDPASLAGVLMTTPSAVTLETLKAQVDALLAALQPLLAALNLGTLDPMAGRFAADGTGPDKLLDTISVSVRPDGTGANIELTVKTIPSAGDSAPVSLQFRSDATTIAPLPASLTATALAPVPGPSVVADLFARLNACFALPLTQRVNAANDNAPVVGGAADVIAPACRGLFLNDDPASFLNGGARVGRNASNNGAFAGLFRPGATGLAWFPGKVEFFRSNGDMVVSGSWRDSRGGTANETYVVRNVAGSLKLVGNQNAYSATVRAFAEDRDFLNTPQFSYYTTGYNLRVDNITSDGTPVFSKVLVTTPQGSTLTLIPAPGQRLLTISPDGVAAGSNSVLRLAGAYRDTTLVADAPSIKEPTLTFASPLRTDAQISALQDQSVWTFEFFHADTAVANVIQQSRTIARPYTIAEIRLKPMAEFTPATRAELIADSAAEGRARFTEPDTAQIGDATTPAWTVPAGALAPTSVGIWGRAPFGSSAENTQGNRFDDTVGVTGDATWAVITCTAQSNADKHCAGGGLYALNTTVNMLELWVLDARQVEISKKAALYPLQ